MQMFKRVFPFVAAVALAVAAQAETTTWENYFYTSQNLAAPDTDWATRDPSPFYQTTVYVICGNTLAGPVSAYETSLQLWNLESAGEFLDANGNDVLMAALDFNMGFGPGSWDLQGGTQIDLEGSPTYYAIMLYKPDDPAERRYFVSSAFSATETDEEIDIGERIAEIADANHWHSMPAPEPTSGLLLLFGLAGLALKRKRV